MERSTLLINKGNRAGISGQEPVISNNGIIGKIMQVTNDKSIILPYHHPSFKLAIMTKQEKVQGILESDASGNSYMAFLRLNDEISIGDTIVTSHLSTIFPKGYPVGKVTKILTTQSKVHKKALLQRFVEPERVNQVAILIKEKNEYETGND
jgi:rod shape-determining protein MreC